MPLLLSARAATSSPLPLVTTREARMLGVAVHSKAYHRVRSGVHVDAGAWAALPDWRKYEVRVHAYLRTHPDAILCLESAAVVLGLPLYGHPAQIHVHDPDRRSSRRFGDVCVHTSVQPRDVVTTAGIRCTSLLDTVVDLARVLPPASALAMADAAVSTCQGGALDVGALRDRVAEQPDRRGRARLAWLLPRIDGRSESPDESVSRAVIEWCGFERPALQRDFWYEGHHDRCDFFFPSCGAIGESDGWGKYDLADPAAARRHLREEKRREDRLRRHLHVFARWEHRDTMRVTPLARALHAAGVPVVRPVQSHMLATLRDHRRLLLRDP